MGVFQIKNNKAVLEISEQASEITSFRDTETGLEYMWQGDPKYWKGRNPTLFPLVGSTYDKTLHINGKEYHTGNHGFTRNSLFTCTAKTEDVIEMTLKDNEETLLQYPFHFELKNRYELKGNEVTITTIVTNTGDEVMPFGQGYHPAFNLPIAGDAADYKLLLNANDSFMNDDALHNEIPLDMELLSATIIIENPKSSVYTLTDGTHGVKVTAEGYPWVAFWSPKAPFVCIEPWHSHTDFEEVNVPFEKREGTILLQPHETWQTSYSIAIF